MTGKRPVLVWIHGGGNITGAGSQLLYDGTELVRRGDVVVVTLNYRLGIFGFLHGRSVAGEAFPTSGNEALLDQAAAMQWVKREIAAFGGDPDNVTIAGESAGGTNVAALMGVPAARGLFHKAIMQSSGTVGHHLSIERAARVFSAILDAAGLTARAEALTAGRGQEAIDLYRTERQVDGKALPPPALWSAMLTDHDFFVPAMRFAELQSDQAPSYAYLFTWRSPIMGGAFGSIHGIDLPFMWGLHNDLGLVSLVGDLTAAEPLSTMFQDALLAFFHTGDPSTSALAWLPYAPPRRSTMILDRR